MPYTRSQCAKFALLEKIGEKVPADWRKECTKDKQRIAEKKKKKHGK